MEEEKDEEEEGEGQYLLTWGWGMYGQLGHGEEEDRNGNKERPKRVKRLPLVYSPHSVDTWISSDVWSVLFIVVEYIQLFSLWKEKYG